MSKISFLKNYPEVKILDGKKIAATLKEQIAKRVKKMKTAPTLAVILIGQNSASSHYVAIKKKFAREIGIKFYLFHYPSRVKEKILIEKINQLNRDKKINGLLVQLPLPQHLKANKIIAAIDPLKDVDGFGPKTKVTPGLNLSILKLIKAASQNLKNKRAIVIAKSETFSQSLAKILKKEKLKIKIIKPTAADLAWQTKKADLLISAVGQPNFISPSLVKKGAILIDVGTTYKKGKVYPVAQKICLTKIKLAKKRKGIISSKPLIKKQCYGVYGDISNEASKLASAVTPVPGGVGPLTVAMLFTNLLKLAEKQKK